MRLRMSLLMLMQRVWTSLCFCLCLCLCLCRSVNQAIRPRKKCAIGFSRVLAIPGDPMSSCSPSSLSPLSSSIFLSVYLSFYSHQGSTWGQLVVVLLVACAARDQFISISFAGLAVRLVLSCSSAQLIVWDCLGPVYTENPAQALVLEDF